MTRSSNPAGWRITIGEVWFDSAAGAVAEEQAAAQHQRPLVDVSITFPRGESAPLQGKVTIVPDGSSRSSCRAAAPLVWEIGAWERKACLAIEVRGGGRNSNGGTSIVGAWIPLGSPRAGIVAMRMPAEGWVLDQHLHAKRAEAIFGLRAPLLVGENGARLYAPATSKSRVKPLTLKALQALQDAESAARLFRDARPGSSTGGFSFATAGLPTGGVVRLRGITVEPLSVAPRGDATVSSDFEAAPPLSAARREQTKKMTLVQPVGASSSSLSSPSSPPPTARIDVAASPSRLLRRAASPPASLTTLPSSLVDVSRERRYHAAAAARERERDESSGGRAEAKLSSSSAGVDGGAHVAQTRPTTTTTLDQRLAAVLRGHELDNARFMARLPAAREFEERQREIQRRCVQLTRLNAELERELAVRVEELRLCESEMLRRVEIAEQRSFDEIGRLRAGLGEADRTATHLTAQLDLSHRAAAADQARHERVADELGARLAAAEAKLRAAGEERDLLRSAASSDALRLQRLGEELAVERLKGERIDSESKVTALHWQLHEMEQDLASWTIDMPEHIENAAKRCVHWYSHSAESGAKKHALVNICRYRTIPNISNESGGGGGAPALWLIQALMRERGGDSSVLRTRWFVAEPSAGGLPPFTIRLASYEDIEGVDDDGTLTEEGPRIETRPRREERREGPRSPERGHGGMFNNPSSSFPNMRAARTPMPRILTSGMTRRVDAMAPLGSVRSNVSPTSRSALKERFAVERSLQAARSDDSGDELTSYSSHSRSASPRSRTATMTQQQQHRGHLRSRPSSPSPYQSHREDVTVLIDQRGPLGVELAALYDAAEKRIVISVVGVAPGSIAARAGVKADDYLEKIGEVELDVWHHDDGDSDGRISDSELSVLLTAVRSLVPHFAERGNGQKMTAHQLMAHYDVEGVDSLGPPELVSLLNHELLGAIVSMIASAPRPTSCRFTRVRTSSMMDSSSSSPTQSSTLLSSLRMKSLSPKSQRRNSMKGTAHGAHLEGTLRKKGVLGGWKSWYFTTQTHYLCWKVKASANAYAGGVDIRGPESTIELLKKGTLLKISGLDADEKHTAAGANRKVRSLVLKAASRKEVPSLEEWYGMLTKSQTSQRLTRSAGFAQSGEDEKVMTFADAGDDDDGQGELGGVAAGSDSAARASGLYVDVGSVDDERDDAERQGDSEEEGEEEGGDTFAANAAPHLRPTSRSPSTTPRGTSTTPRSSLASRMVGRGAPNAWWEPLGIALGCTVEHPKRGSGVVILINRDDDKKVHVKFSAGEVHRYNLRSWGKFTNVQAAPRSKHDLLHGGGESSPSHVIVPSTSGRVSPKRRMRRNSMTGKAHGQSTEGELMKQGSLGTWQRRYFCTQSHYLCYKLSQSAEHFAGGIDIRSEESTIELTKRGTQLKITGLDADSQSHLSARKLRTLILKTSARATQSPTLEQWFTSLTKSQATQRLHVQSGVALEEEDGPDIVAAADFTEDESWGSSSPVRGKRDSMRYKASLGDGNARVDDIDGDGGVIAPVSIAPTWSNTFSKSDSPNTTAASDASSASAGGGRSGSTISVAKVRRGTLLKQRRKRRSSMAGESHHEHNIGKLFIVWCVCGAKVILFNTIT